MNTGSGRLNEQGNPVTPVAAVAELPSPVPGDSVESAIKIESSPAPELSRHRQAQSVTRDDAPPLTPMGVATTTSRSQLLRRPRFDYRDPAARAQYEALLEAEIAAVRSGASLPGSPSTASNLSSPESASMAIRGSGRRVTRNPQMATIEEQPSPTPVRQDTTQGRPRHMRFSSSESADGRGSEAARGRGSGRGK